ncbi:hypothetical protein BJ956_003002 [Arthrobacter psychrochitiniphilus]|nr:hypothetical protein [Arthrobacter psychrochitiniphilus]
MPVVNAASMNTSTATPKAKIQHTARTSRSSATRGETSSPVVLVSVPVHHAPDHSDGQP